MNWFGYISGQSVRIKGTPLHNGKVGHVVGWREEWGQLKTGLIPVYMPEFSATYFWWFAPWQLEKL